MKTFQIDPQYTDEKPIILWSCAEILIKRPTINSPLLIAEDVSVDTTVTLEERNEEFPGFTTFSKPFREYYDASTAHVLGYMGNIDEKYEEWSSYPDLDYKMDDIVGITGIERSEEHVLRE